MDIQLSCPILGEASTRHWDLVQKQGALLAMLQCSLSLGERVRVRGFSHNPGNPCGATVWAQGAQRPSPPPSPEGKGAR